MKEVFSSIVGNTALTSRLGSDILSGKLPHALIFEGPEGTGKHTLARLCAAALVCERHDDKSEPLPCLKCISCKKVIESKSPDVIVLGTDGKATIGVDTIRFLREDISIVPNDSDHKVYVIEDADKLTVPAQNALLLTLEEPPSYAHFFLLCENSGLLLETIRSRAPVMRTEILTREQVDEYISSTDRRAAQMKLTNKRDYAELIVASGLGIGKALKYLDPEVFAPIKQNRALAYDLTSAAVKRRNASEILPIILKFSKFREPLYEQLNLVNDAIRDLILLKKSDTATLCFFSDLDEAIELSDMASLSFLYSFWEAVQTAMDEIDRNANVRLCLVKMALSANIID